METFVPPQLPGEIVGWRGKLADVRLEDGRIVSARIARRLGCIFGNIVGWKVVVQFRKNPSKSALIIQRTA